MKAFLSHLARRIGRFFWSWGFLKFVLWSVTLLVLLYVEEDWRGARAWAATKTKWEARGESFDFKSFIPPPIPDAQNLGALPIFQLDPKSGEPLALQQALKQHPNATGLPLGSLMKGRLPNAQKLKAELTARYRKAFKDQAPPASTLTQFNALYPFIEDLRLASSQRPFCRLSLDYMAWPPYARSFLLLTDQIALSKLITLQAVLALQEGLPDVALSAIRLNFILTRGAVRDSSLVGGLVGIGMAAINTNAIYIGLCRHQWNEAQLSELNQILGSVDFLTQQQWTFRSETTLSLSAIDFYKVHRRNLTCQEDVFSRGVLTVWPGGWWERNKAQIADERLEHISDFDPGQHRAFPKKVEAENAQAPGWGDWAPWKIFATTSRVVTAATSKFAQAQVWNDEARMACGLERYRLKHGAYPQTLEALAGDGIESLPHDIFTGQPYRYRRMTDGSYLLYSVGWNEVDEGGRTVFEKENPTAPDYRQGDWVWPRPQVGPL